MPDQQNSEKKCFLEAREQMVRMAKDSDVFSRFKIYTDSYIAFNTSLLGAIAADTYRQCMAHTTKPVRNTPTR